jgi:hypothetical protein
MSNDTTPEIRTQVKPVNFKGFYGRENVKMIKQGKAIADMTYLINPPVQGVKKLSKTEYMILKTGEVKEYDLSTKKQNESLRKTFTKLRQLIKTNFSVCDSELFLTLTYKENMQDAERLYTDFKKFFMRLRYEMDGIELAYISIAEPQGRGAWHLHILLKRMDGGMLYIDNRKMQNLWGHGWTETKRLKGDNPGAYFVAYFQNTEEGDASLIADPKKAKKYVKGGRLDLYPKDFKFFRCSRNIEKPTTEIMNYREVINEYGQPIFEQAFELIEVGRDNKQVGNAKNLIVKQQFNKKKKS